MENTTAQSLPVGERERIVNLDIIRGFALLGILVMNIQSFAMIDSAYFFPHTYGDMTGLNKLVWQLGFFLADSKFITLFSMLFGAGICLMTGRAEERGARVGRLHYRRMGALLLLGWTHAYLFWSGDILVTYALCGMIIYPLRKLRPLTLLIIGLVSIGFGVLISIGAGSTAPNWPPESREGILQGFAPDPEAVTEQLAIYRGGGLRLFAHRASSSLAMQTMVFWFWSFWRDAGAMLLGMGLFKLGLLSAQRSRRFFTILLVPCLIGGLYLVLRSYQRHYATDWEVFDSFFVASQLNSIGAILIAIAYLSLISLATLAGYRNKRLAAVGRMAFSNYLGHTLICTLLFYGPFYPLFGYVSRTGQFGLVVAIWILQLIVSPLWLARYHFGPAEWLWRSMTYGKRQPWRRQAT
ncbi:MAG: DUF418 domain-containing protein [bacterium]|nr:DUF418 domain-containing protein [bacterium]